MDIRKPRPAKRSAYTLVELIVSLIAASLLMIGMGSSLFVVSRAFDEGDSQEFQNIQSGKIVDSILIDMRYATRFSERTANAVTFFVPDRDNDGDQEKIRYAWSGVPGDPLTKSLNDSAPATLVGNVESLDFRFLTRTVLASDLALSADGVAYKTFSEAKLASNSDSLTLDTPDMTEAGDLLIAFVSTDFATDANLAAPAGWTLIDRGNSEGQVTLGVWYKFADVGEPSSHSFTWQGNQKAYGSMLRITGADPDKPDSSSWPRATDRSAQPTSPSVTTTLDNTLILRIGAFDDDDVTIDDTGLKGHPTVTMDESSDGNGTASAGAGYLLQPSAGPSGPETFVLIESEQARTVTLAIAPPH